MKLLYAYQTRIGTAKIKYNPTTRRYHAFIDDEDLGNYLNEQQAADDLSGGHTFSHSSGIDTSTLGIPEDVQEWASSK